MKRILFIADQFADASRTPGAAHPGGAEMTDEVAIEACPWPVECARIEEFDPRHFRDFDLHIIGNLGAARVEHIRELARLRRHILFEHDVRICRYRGNFPIAREAFHRHAQRCICPHRLWRPLFETALGAIFLTHRQLDVYRHNPFFADVRLHVLGSSLMNRAFLERAERVRRRRRRGEDERSIDTAIVYSRHAIKGYTHALEYCRSRGIEPYIIRDLEPGEVLDVLEDTRRFIYTPIGLEPAGRMLLEARFLGCEVYTNPNAGVCGESWWHMPDDRALEVLRDAPRRFWRLVESLRAGIERGESGAPPAWPISPPYWEPYLLNGALAAAESLTGARWLFGAARERTRARANRVEEITPPTPPAPSDRHG